MQTIYIDISNKGVIPTIHAKQGDVGRKFLAVLTDGGVPYSPPAGSAFSVWYSGDSGEGNYTDIGDKSAFTIEKNNVAVELITQMLSRPGAGCLSLSLHSVGGDQIGLWNIHYCVEEVPGVESEEATTHYTAFSKTVGTAVDAAHRAEQAAEALENITPESIGALPAIEDTSHPGCYHRTLDGVKEWINPPMELGVEYRTTERWSGHPVYTKLVPFGYMPNATEKIVPWAPDSGTVSKVVRCAGTNDQGDALPYVTAYADYRLAVGPSYIAINTNANKSAVVAYVQIWYTKN